MILPELPERLDGLRIHMVGIKGTGMCALAELLSRCDSAVTGSDTHEVFYTDRILQDLGIPYAEGFSPSNLPAGTDLVVYSAAYSPDTNPELAAALERGIPALKYTDALGSYSRRFDSSGISGVHGKTTTTALAGVIARAIALPAQILAGSAVGDFGGKSTLVLGDRYFIAETCEYRRHFLAFSPKRIVLTSVESDHQDYFPTYGSIRDAFVEYALRLPEGGQLIYCADDPGAREVARIVQGTRPDIQRIPYGFEADGPYRIVSLAASEERTVLSVAGFGEPFLLRIPGRHVALDALAALALNGCILGASWTAGHTAAVRAALEAFRGSRRRSEIIADHSGILIMDDYAHHPTAIRTTLEGLRSFYPKRRIVASFMSHTYTRTAALLEDFAASFAYADLLILHRIYPSAREQYSGTVDGRTLYERTLAERGNVFYFDDPMDAVDSLRGELREGDLFITMGAGDNWRLGRALAEILEKESPPGAETDAGRSSK